VAVVAIVNCSLEGPMGEKGTMGTMVVRRDVPHCPICTDKYLNLNLTSLDLDLLQQYTIFWID
jgi:hypothetical protein